MTRSARWTLGGLFLLYLLTLSPTVGWEDTAAYHLKTLTESPDHYRPYFALLRMFEGLPLGGTPSWRMNLLSPCLMAAVLAVVWFWVRELTGREGAATLATAALGVSHLFWHFAVVTKVYPLMLLAIAGTALAVARWVRRGEGGALAAAGFLVGFAPATHPYALGAGLLLAGALIARRPCRRGALAACGGLLAGLLLVVGIYRDRFAEEGTDAVRSVLLSDHSVSDVPHAHGPELFSVDPGAIPRDLVEGAGYLIYQYPIALVFAGLGLLRLARRDRRLLFPVALALAGYFAVAFDFNVPLKINFYLPFYLLLAGPIAEGLPETVSRRGRAGLAAALVALPPVVYAVAVFAVFPVLRPASLYDRPDAAYKDRARYYLFPAKNGVRESERFARRVADAVESDAWLLLDFQEWDLLRFAMGVGWTDKPLDLRHLTADSEEVRAAVDARLAGGRPVYVGVQYAALLEGAYRLAPAADGAVFRVTPSDAGPPRNH